MRGCEGCQRRKAAVKAASIAAYRKAKAQILGAWKPPVVRKDKGK